MSKLMPNHIAFIMDGNGRWAESRGLPRLEGHRKGVEAVRRVLEALAEQKVPYATFYAFSTENWGRPAEEVEGLMGLIRWYFKSELANLMKKNIRVRVIGDLTPGAKISKDILDILVNVQETTKNNTGITATFAINYGGRNELMRAAQKWAEMQTTAGAVQMQADEMSFAACLDTHDLPEVDLLVRTSGEKRVSNFLLWQAAYAELYFSNALWPDFNEKELASAIEDFAGRERRFGGLVAKTA